MVTGDETVCIRQPRSERMKPLYYCSYHEVGIDGGGGKNAQRGAF